MIRQVSWRAGQQNKYFLEKTCHLHLKGDYSMLKRIVIINKLRLTIVEIRVKYRAQAVVAEQADALSSGRSELYARVGSTPTFGIIPFSFGGLEIGICCNITTLSSSVNHSLLTDWQTTCNLYARYHLCKEFLVTTCANSNAAVRWRYETP